MPIPDRRVLVVLTTLLGAMTLASGLLLVLEPAPKTPLPTFRLRSVDRGDRRQSLFETSTPVDPGRYAAIVIHDGAAQGGPIDTTAASRRYHFVIGNGNDVADGAIEAGPCWQGQLDGLFAGSDPAAAHGGSPIGIFLVGDTTRQSLTELQTERLCWLVRRLQLKFEIAGEHVSTPQGRFFPHSTFGRQLLTHGPR